MFFLKDWFGKECIEDGGNLEEGELENGVIWKSNKGWGAKIESWGAKVEKDLHVEATDVCLGLLLCCSFCSCKHRIPL